MKERRVFNSYPENQQTEQNNRETSVSDDILFEPEQANFINGFIGDTSALPVEDLSRTPTLLEIDAERQKYQLSVAANYIDPDSLNRESVAFYTDLLRQIGANGGDVTNPNRIFSSNFYAWTPPIEYDKHVNFSRYRWVGEGTADIQGEYVTKEMSHSKVVIYEYNGTVIIKREVEIINGLSSIKPVGTFVEDGSANSRFIYKSTGSAWVLIQLRVVTDIPTDFTGVTAGTHYYVTRTGPEFNRPIIWKYSTAAGRWLSAIVVINDKEPDSTREGMIWEDSRLGNERKFKIFSNGSFIDLVYTAQLGPPGTIGLDGEYLYDIRNYADLTDEWDKNNWWVHFEDLSDVDKANRTNADQGIRPILEFWNGIEYIIGDTKEFRNDSPIYKKYGIDPITKDIVDTTEGTTIFEYKKGGGSTDDPVIGFPLSFNADGEFEFEVTLETDISTFIGNHFFKDNHTGLLHGIWEKSDKFTNQAEDINGLFALPVGISSNPDHDLLTVASRSRMLSHIISILKAQPTFSGAATGLNGYRWSDKDPTIGAVLIDAEQTHLRVLATLQRANLDIPNAIRLMAKEYNKTLFRFSNKLSQYWDNLIITDGDGTLSVTAVEAVDGILTSLFTGRTEDFSFYHAKMGTYIETLLSPGMATAIGTTNKPIFMPPSAAHVGAAQAFKPIAYTDGSKTTLRGHDGVEIASYGDERDLVWLELQNRLFITTDSKFNVENSTSSARQSPSNFFLKDYYGGLLPNSIDTVSQVIDEFNNVVSPTDGQKVFSTNSAVFATFSAGAWLTKSAKADDIFLNSADNEFYMFNGLTTSVINRWNNSFVFDYNTTEFRNVVRRDFERFIVFKSEDFSENIDFDVNDKFTWNYRSAGVEGHYKAIYKRIYNTVHPEIFAWEIAGYSIEPDWWRSQYVPDSTRIDGTPKYSNANIMWTDLIAGRINHPNGVIQNPVFEVTAPIPVDVNGDLLDPIAAGIIIESSLDIGRIDDIWIYGDGSPMEQEFIVSPFYPYSISLSGYIMKNGIWVDSLWSEAYITVGETGNNKLFRAPHIVHESTLNRPAINVLLMHLEKDTSGAVVERIGVNAWVSEAVALTGGNPINDFGKIIRNTSPVLAWKTAGYINSKRTIISTLARKEIPFSDVHVIPHTSQPIRTEFMSGMLIIRESGGFRVFGFDPFDPFFTVENPAVPIVAGQVLLTEDFVVAFVETDPDQLKLNNVTGGSVFPNNKVQNSFTLTKFQLPNSGIGQDTALMAVLVNGQKLKEQFVTTDPTTDTVTIDSIVVLSVGDKVTVQVLTTQSNSSTQTKQFIVNGVSFPYLSSGSGEIVKVEYGKFFNTSTDVINFMISYERYLVKQGWDFETISEEGEVRNWLLGAKRFARWVIDQQQIDILDSDIFYYSPIRNEAKFVSTFGQTLNVESIMNGAFGILNRRSLPIPIDDTFVSRIDDELLVRRVNIGDEESQMYGLRINVVEAEHVVLFSNITRFNDIIYDPTLGIFQNALIVDSYRTLNWQGRIEANGFIISGGELLPNFEKQAFDITKFYDRYTTIDDPDRRQQARNLYGFVPANQSRSGSAKSVSITERTSSDSSQYMIPIGAADRSRFDYYRGMIQAKGTIRAITAFSRGTKIGNDNITINEDWAWKLQEFGDTRFDTAQFKIDRLDFRDDVQVVFFGEPTNILNKTLEIEDMDRNDLENSTRWLLPPKLSVTTNVVNILFPINRSTLLVDVERHKYFAKIFDISTNQTVIDFIHYDPELDQFDTEARTQIDFESVLDPARYNTGPDASFAANRVWTKEQVGCLWWKKDRSQYVDYRGLIPKYEDMAPFWGKPLYYKVKLTRIDDVVTIETFDFTDNGRAVAVVHGITISDTIEVGIRKATETDYNIETLIITATSSTQFQYTINTEPSTPATGDPELVIGHVDIYEWVESPVPPADWENYVDELNDTNHPNGTPLNIVNPSYVVINKEVAGIITPTYYFWALNSSGKNRKAAIPTEAIPGKSFSSKVISERLSNPTGKGLHWFAPVNGSHMLVFTDGEAVEDGYGFEVLIDERNLQTHDSFILVSEKNTFTAIPSEVVEKVIDSLSLIDAKGNVVPSPLLTESEKFGACFFPIQTVFADVSLANSVYVIAVNALLVTKNLSEVDILTGIFKLEDELGTTNSTGFWERTAFISSSVGDEKVFDIVDTITERDRRATAGFYAVADIVRVILSGKLDPWDDSEVATNYQFDGVAFAEVGVDNNTVKINSNISQDTNTYRTIFNLVYDVLTKIEQNSLMFSLLHEMLRQHADIRCDWFFKTSYITSHVSTTTSTAPFIEPDETLAIRDNILDVKAYRTKLRSETNSISVSEIEPFTIDLTEIITPISTIVFDRLSCHLLDECGWDTFAWDTRELPSDKWDAAFWELNNLGRDDYYLVKSFVGDSVTTKFQADPLFDPTLYNVKLVVKENGTEISTSTIPFMFRITHVQIFLDMVVELTSNFVIEIWQAKGFYADNDPSRVGTSLENTLSLITPSSYEHATARNKIPNPVFTSVAVGDNGIISTSVGAFIEVYLDSVLQEPQVDYQVSFDYTNSVFSALFLTPLSVGSIVAFTFMRGCLDINDPLGGRPEERIVTDVIDSVNICVVNDWTPAYAGWDTTPWTINRWEEAPDDIGRRVFIISAGSQETILADTVWFPTSELITVSDPMAIIGTNDDSYIIKSIEVKKGSANFVTVTEGIEYNRVGIFNNIIQTKTPDDVIIITDGTLVYPTTTGSTVLFVFINGTLKTELIDYSLDASKTIITLLNGIPMGNTLMVRFDPYISTNDIIRYRFNGWPVGPLGNFVVNAGSFPAGILGAEYDVIGGILIFDILAPDNLLFSITYRMDRDGDIPRSLLVRMKEIVTDIIPDHLLYDSPLGVETDRPVGVRILNSNTNRIWLWDGTTWMDEGAILSGTQVYVLRTQEIWKYNGSTLDLLFTVGDTGFASPPILNYPINGEGITFGTYSFGTFTNANVEYPDAFQVMQHTGDCPV